ncbi:pyruvate-formate lyase-activating enzyme [Candidatus Scalindua japonica]|uniref:Pyruvate-formate lyase-activating enzyme n=1 Tax=Candidatus Scalindua japonica TaxID=1284222 RepID=A0A286TTQ4_9BACT|nr:pyruvate-formate lyase-activating enzyme [Candidatus Scalindua japonica]
MVNRIYKLIVYSPWRLSAVTIQVKHTNRPVIAWQTNDLLRQLQGFTQGGLLKNMVLTFKL